jgi:hypothetical protein
MLFIHRINRILEAPRGNALLVGVGGSGKQSLSRLSAFISSLEVFQVQLRKGYGINDLKLDLGNYICFLNKPVHDQTRWLVHYFQIYIYCYAQYSTTWYRTLLCGYPFQSL